MATVAPESVRSLVDDHDAIAAVVQRYFDGSRVGDASTLEEAFHPDARMFGALGPQRIDISIQEFFKLAASMPMGTSYRPRLTSVNPVGDAAMAVVAEDGCWGSVSFVDYFPWRASTAGGRS